MTRLRAPRIALIGLLLGLGAAAPAADPHASQARIPGRDALRAAIAAMDGMTTRISMLTRVGGRVFYLERGAAARLVMRDRSGRETVLVDHAAIDRFAASPDGSLLVISTGEAAARVLQVIETKTGTARPDRIAAPHVASLSWAADGRSFFYTRASDANAPWRSERHVLGEDARRDRVLLDAARLPFAFDGQPALVAVAAIPGSDFVIARVSDAVSGRSAFYTAPSASLGAAAIPWTPVAALADEVTAIAMRGQDRRGRPWRPARLRARGATCAPSRAGTTRTPLPAGGRSSPRAAASSPGWAWPMTGCISPVAMVPR